MIASSTTARGNLRNVQRRSAVWRPRTAGVRGPGDLTRGLTALTCRGGPFGTWARQLREALVPGSGARRMATGILPRHALMSKGCMRRITAARTGLGKFSDARGRLRPLSVLPTSADGGRAAPSRAGDFEGLRVQASSVLRASSRPRSSGHGGHEPTAPAVSPAVSADHLGVQSIRKRPEGLKVLANFRAQPCGHERRGVRRRVCIHPVASTCYRRHRAWRRGAVPAISATRGPASRNCRATVPNRPPRQDQRGQPRGESPAATPAVRGRPRRPSAAGRSGGSPRRSRRCRSFDHPLGARNQSR